MPAQNRTDVDEYASSATSNAERNPLNGAHELCKLTAAQLTSLYQRREVSPVEVTEVVLDRAQSVNRRLNAFTFIDQQGAVEAAKESEVRWTKKQPRGPLDGIPATIKNLVFTRGWPAQMGSLTVASNPAENDAPTVSALRDAGAVLIGTTTTCEFGWKGVTDSPVSGITRNPWNTDLTSGGSSGGAAVAAATGCGVVHLGSDGGGSIRIPAAFTGVFGHKPTFGRVPYFPSSAFAAVGHLGPITRTVDDAALMLEVMSKRDTRDWYQNPLAFSSVLPLENIDWRGLRVGLWTEPPAGTISTELIEAATSAVQKLEALGAIIEPIILPGKDLLLSFNTIWFSGAAYRVNRIPKEMRSSVDAGLLRIVDIAAGFSAIDYAEASAQRAAFGAQMDALLERFDFVISPATTVSAFAAGFDVPPGSGLTHWTEWAGFNFPLNLSQQPACSVPTGFTSAGLPIGLQIVGARGGDKKVLEAAQAIQSIYSGHTRTN